MSLKGQVSFFDKPRVMLLEDVFTLCEDFKKGTEWEIYMEHENNYIIYHDNVFYGPFKNKCRKYE